MAMKICRFELGGAVRIGLVTDNASVLDLAPAGITALASLLEEADPVARLMQTAALNLPRIPQSEIKLLPPVERQEIWAAGVTYQRSKAARMEESDFSASAYDRVYVAERPEIFFKAVPEKVVGAGDSVGIRADARWSVPEPELALVMNSRGQIVGQTIGNDMSSRDIEGENLLYLPQAKIYDRSCALGPWITLGASEAQAREWKIGIEIRRNGESVFRDATAVSQLKRGFEELAGYLFRSQTFPHGAVLLTGTGIVPPDTFTLREKDEILIEISGIGLLQNSVIMV
jgi:2-dehydro-3-deoxy-D-arabinonate dehydratase